MSMQIRIEAKGEYLDVKVSGPFSLLRAKGFVDEVVQVSLTHGLERILVDITAMTRYVDNPLMERFSIASYVGAAQRPGTSVAFLFSPEQMLPDRFDENVAVNRGGHLITTADIGEALEWLGVGVPKVGVG